MAISQKELELIKEDAEQHDFADFTQKRVCLGKYIEISIAKFLCTTAWQHTAQICFSIATKINFIRLLLEVESVSRRVA